MLHKARSWSNQNTRRYTITVNIFNASTRIVAAIIIFLVAVFAVLAASLSIPHITQNMQSSPLTTSQSSFSSTATVSNPNYFSTTYILKTNSYSSSNSTYVAITGQQTCEILPDQPEGMYFRLLNASTPNVTVAGANVRAILSSSCILYSTQAKQNNVLGTSRYSFLTNESREWYQLNTLNGYSYNITVNYSGQSYNLAVNLTMSSYTCATLYVPSGASNVTSSQNICS